MSNKIPIYCPQCFENLGSAWSAGWSMWLIASHFGLEHDTGEIERGSIDGEEAG